MPTSTQDYLSLNTASKGVDALIFNDCMTSGAIWSRTIGAYQIANVLRNAGYKVQVVDWLSQLCVENLDLIKVVLDKFVGSDTVFVGFSSTFLSSSLDIKLKKPVKSGIAFNQIHRGGNAYAMENGELKQIVTHVKTRNPQTHILLGGSRAGANDTTADVVVMGYGETQMLDYMRWRKGKHPFFQFKRTPTGAILLDYDKTASTYDFPASQMLWQTEDCILPNEVLPLEVARGCIFKCKFCHFPLNGKSKNDYIKAEEGLYAELMHNYEQYGTTTYILSDDTYNDTTLKLEAMQRVVDRLPFKFRFGTYLRLDLIASKPEQAALLKANGLVNGFFGIETMHHPTGKIIGKGMDPEKLVETLHWLREDVWGNDVISFGSFILGLPRDTMETMERWVERVIDPSFPLHDMMIQPLNMGKPDLSSASRVNLSDLELNAHDYGYRWPDENFMWVNEQDGTSYKRISEWGDQVYQYIIQNGRISYTTHTALSAMGLGYSHEQLSKHGRIGIRNLGLYNRTYAWYLEYMSKLLALPTF